MRRFAPLAAALAAALTLTAPAHAAFEGSDRTETWISTPDGETLHAEVLRPKGATDATKTPVILIVSPYLGHAVDGADAPSTRFADFIDGAKLFQRGYSVVMVDLRGSGGSTGCLDILGPGEQTDIITSVEWAATRPWSTGRVGMYGKSYDANTGIAGAALRPKGLAAVVAQQVVPDRYRGSYSGRVRYLQSLAYPLVSYGTQAEGGFTDGDDDQYTLNSVSHSADCQANLLDHYNDDESSDFWRVRDFVEKGAGSTVPMFMTTGFLDANTNIGGGAIDFFNGLGGPKRLWLGWWAHVRGDEKSGTALAMGRAGWIDEVMRFYDHHVKGVPLAAAPTDKDPIVAVQGSDGVWRSEDRWPPADTGTVSAPLKPGTFTDDGRNQGSGDSAAGPGGTGPTVESGQFGAGVWTVSPPLPHDVHLAGTPSATVELWVTAPRTNLVVNLYAIAPDGKATMLSRGARLVDASSKVDVEMYPTEWLLKAGQRIGVLVSGANNEAWVHVPTRTSGEVRAGTIRLPALRFRRSEAIEGKMAPRLKEYLTAAPFPVPAAALSAATQPALVPPAMIARPAAAKPVAPAKPKAKRRLTARLKLRGALATVSGRAPSGFRVTVKILRGKRTVASRKLTARKGRYSTRLRVRGARKGLRAGVTARRGKTLLRASARR